LCLQVSLEELGSYRRGGALDSSDVLLPYPIMLLSSPITNILTDIYKHKIHIILPCYPVLQLCVWNAYIEALLLEKEQEYRQRKVGYMNYEL
tara:strand:+ start:492 stop:767 length:276 start_codon:yes stop_codon:yes gene_type:complete